MNVMLAINAPDDLDRVVVLTYLIIAFGLAGLGYVCMILDIRAYLRSLRRALVVVTGYRYELPQWVLQETPPCLRALGLKLPCTVDDVLAAYRQKVKHLHPDLGGDRRQFMRLQSHFEQAIEFMQKRTS